MTTTEVREATNDSSAGDPLLGVSDLLWTSLAQIVEEGWEGCELSAELAAKLLWRGNSYVGALFWHGEQWFEHSRRVWLNDHERGVIIRTMCALRVKFGEHDPAKLMCDFYEKRKFYPLTHQPYKYGGMVAMHSVYLGC